MSSDVRSVDVEMRTIYRYVLYLLLKLAYDFRKSQKVGLVMYLFIIQSCTIQSTILLGYQFWPTSKPSSYLYAI